MSCAPLCGTCRTGVSYSKKICPRRSTRSTRVRWWTGGLKNYSIWLFFRSLGENRLVSTVKEFQTSEDRKAITLYLREGITWYDDELFTADDVCFTINAMSNPKTPSPGSA